MKTFITRSISAIVFAAIMLGGLLYNQWSFSVLFFVINAGCLWEYFGLIESVKQFNKINKSFIKFAGVLTGSIVYLLITGAAQNILPDNFFIVLFPILFLFFGLELYSLSEKAIQNAALNLLGIIYISVPFGFLHFLIQGNTDKWFPEGVSMVLGILLLIWSNDTFAYIGGSLVGRNKLFPSISPGKTWEGFGIGFIGCLLISFVLSRFFINHELNEWLIVAVIVSITGTIGDLFESMMKRNLNVKDSGNIMPGHGGLLDRFDAFIFCIPFVLVYLTFGI